jgi:hypothetical protein
MKICQTCGSSYSERISYCFVDGAVLDSDGGALAEPIPSARLATPVPIPRRGRSLLSKKKPPARGGADTGAGFRVTPLAPMGVVGPDDVELPAGNAAAHARPDASAPTPTSSTPVASPVDRTPPSSENRSYSPPPPTLVPEASGDTEPEFEDLPFPVQRDASDPTPLALSRDLAPTPPPAGEEDEKVGWVLPAAIGGGVLAAIVLMVAIATGGIALFGGPPAEPPAPQPVAVAPRPDPAPTPTPAAVHPAPDVVPEPLVEPAPVGDVAPPAPTPLPLSPTPAPAVVPQPARPTPGPAPAPVVVVHPSPSPAPEVRPPWTVEPAPTPRPAPTVGSGSLSVTSQPTGADVYVDGILMDTAPLGVTVAFGNHAVEGRLSGYRPAIQRVDVVDSAGASVRLVLEPMVRSGTVLLMMEGWTGARLSVDGRAVGNLPARVEGLTEGSHTFVVEGEQGRREITRDVRLQDSSPTRIDLGP